jgi:pimeloyl-ACP methyl ester carboxylesterase
VRDDWGMRITTDDGVRLAAEVAGSGPGLLLVHGFGGAQADFADHRPALARDHTVVTFDHRGHGASDQPTEVAAYSLDRLVADTVAVADTVGLGRFRLVGHSMGGMVARRLALRFPERVEALILMDTSPGPVPQFDAALMDAAADIAFTQGKAALKEALDAAAPLESPAYRRLVAERPGYQAFCDAKFDALSVVMWGALARAIAYQPDDLTAMAAITCPTLVIVGEQDEPFLGPSRMMAETIAGAELVVVSDAGHSPQFENPEAWISALDAFLARVVPARG